MKCFGWVTTFL